MYCLPTSVTIHDKPYGITQNGDYRMVIDCFSALNDAELSEQERLYSALIIFYKDISTVEDIFSEFADKDIFVEAVKQMYWFFDCGQKEVGKQVPYKLVDWEQDEQMIAAAVNKVANKEIRAEKYLHWWTFMGYYTSVGDSVLSTVVSIREKIKKGKKLEDYEKEFRHDNPQYFKWQSKTVEEQEADMEFETILQQWNKE